MPDLRRRLEDLVGPAPEPDIDAIAARAAERRRHRRIARAATGVAVVALLVVGLVATMPGTDDTTSVVVDAPVDTATDPAPTSTPPSTAAEDPDDASEWWTGAISPEFRVSDSAVVGAVEDPARPPTVMVVDPAAQESPQTLLQAPEGWKVAGLALDRSGPTVYTLVVPFEGEGGAVLAMRPGAPVDLVADLPGARFSAYGNLLALSPGRDRIVVAADTDRLLSIDLGAEKAIGGREILTREGGLRSLEWVADDALVVEHGEAEAARELGVVDTTTWQWHELGPADGAPDGTGWSPGALTEAGMIVVESCCALDANSYDGGTSIVTVDVETGEVLARESAPTGMLGLRQGPGDALVGVGWGELWVRDEPGSEWRPVDAPVLRLVASGW